MSTPNDDPRRLRELLSKASQMAAEHDLHGVLVGLSGPEGDLALPEVIDFVQSALRVDDSIFRMTRERAVLWVTDARRERAEEIMQRVVGDFYANYCGAKGPEVSFSYLEVPPDAGPLTVKDVLPRLFC